MRLHCLACGKSVSTEVPEATVLRAVVWCPECIERVPDTIADAFIMAIEVGATAAKRATAVHES